MFILQGGIAYVPQEAWIQNATLRDNILFGQAHNDRKYEDIVQACALEPDFKILSAGDQTEIGEKVGSIHVQQKVAFSAIKSLSLIGGVTCLYECHVAHISI